VVTVAAGSQAPPSATLELVLAVDVPVDVPEVATLPEPVGVFVTVLVVVTTPPSAKVDVPVVTVVAFVVWLVVEALVVRPALVSTPIPELDEFGPQAAAKEMARTASAASKRVRMADS
jgi:hypothetical protein